jgi:restriction system protein
MGQEKKWYWDYIPRKKIELEEKPYDLQSWCLYDGHVRGIHSFVDTVEKEPFRSRDVHCAGCWKLLQCKRCPFCDAETSKFKQKDFDRGALSLYSEQSVRICKLCGWWIASAVESRHAFVGLHGGIRVEYAATGTIRQFRQFQIEEPIQAIRDELYGNYASRFKLDPTIFEQVVTSVFRDCGYQSEHTGKTSDGGIDVLLRNADGDFIGVQVKRHRNKILVEQIREIIGVLVLKGMTKGIFVTTSQFSSGSIKAAEEAGSCGFRIELVDAQRFLEVLGVAQRAARKNFTISNLPFHLEDLQLKTVRRWGWEL